MSADTLTATGVLGLTPQAISEGPVGWVLVEPDELVGDYQHRGFGDLMGITPTGQRLFETPLDATGVVNPSALWAGPTLAGDPGVGVVALEIVGDGAAVPGPLTFEAFNTSGVELTPLQPIGPTADVVVADQAFSTPTGYHLEWVTSAGGATSLWQADVSGTTGQVVPGSLVSGPGAGILPFASTLVGGEAFTVMGNQAQLAGSPAVQVPGEPPLSMTEVVATGLAGVDGAAVAFADSGTAYVTIFDAATNSFSPRVELDWGGAGQLHLVGLPDGDFVVSWLKGTQFLGEVFTPTGEGGGVITLAGQVMGIDGAGALLTLAQVAGQTDANQVIEGYAINGGSSGGGSSVSTSAANYTAPDGVTTITLTGSNQTVHANNGGDTIFSNDTGNVLIGGTGNDTFHLGRGGDWATGGGGTDTFDFAGIPWAGGHITDFSGSDALDLTGLMSTTPDTGTDGFADGYLKITDDGSGNAQVWADYNVPGNNGWWLVETLNGVSPASLQHTGDVISIGSSSGPTDVTTAAADYTAPATVKTITLTGSHQTIDASATDGVTINSNDSGNALIGGPGDDTFHLGRGGDFVTGGAGADTFAYAAIPWAGGGITDFNASEGDKIDVTGLLANASFTGPDPFAAGYLMFGADSSGNAQLLADYNLPGNNGWWLVATLDGVSTSSLHYANGLIT